MALRYRETFQNQPNEYDMNDEEYQKPRPRKRRPPQNHEFAEVRSSYAIIHRAEKSPSGENLELKMLLKEQQGKDLSLSEILQRGNLSLSDLLQGKENVIDLLKMSLGEGTTAGVPTISETPVEIATTVSIFFKYDILDTLIYSIFLLCNNVASKGDSQNMLPFQSRRRFVLQLK